MKKIVIAALLSCMFFVSQVFADNTGKTYIAADYGTAKLSSQSIYDSFGMLRVAGGYHYNSNLSAEVGYSTGDVTGVAGPYTVDLSLRSFEVSALAAFPINAVFDLTAKLGLVRHSLSATGVTVTDSTASNTVVMYGVGAQYHVNSQVSVRAQYEDFGEVDDASNNVKKTAFSLGVVYNF
jgi:opacity protein-like surface antigen